MDCTDWFSEIWSVEIEAGQRLQITVDTISEETVFDPAVLFGYSAIPSESEIEDIFDDEMPCSYTPEAEGQCVVGEWTATETGALYFEVVVAQDFCNSDFAEYSLVVKIEGEEIEPLLSEDDFLQE